MAKLYGARTKLSKAKVVEFKTELCKFKISNLFPLGKYYIVNQMLFN